jgi:hypothetical protein
VTPPSLSHYNTLAAARALVTGSGAPLRFVTPDASPMPYEERAYHLGEVLTRPDNWHDAYNAEVWLEYPRSKATLNRLHFEAFTALRAKGDSARGRVRDRLTQFDECGIIVAGIPDSLWTALRAHRWREVFVDRRTELLISTRFLFFGHASRDALRAPFFGLCGKALRIEADGSDLTAVDIELERRLASADFLERWPALPLLGIPGLSAENEDPAYYDDTRQFRPARTMPAGSSPDSR